MSTQTKNEPSLPSKSFASVRDIGLILDSLDEAVVAFDGRGAISYANEPLCKMFGYRREDVMRSLLTRLMPGLARRAPLSLPVNIELTGIRADTSQFHVQLHLRVLAEEPGIDRKRSYVGVVRNLTAQRAEREHLSALKEELDRAARSRALLELSSHISHEINQPLTAIVLYAQTCERLLTRGLHDAEMLSDTLHKLSAQALRAGKVSERVQRYVSGSRTSPKRQDINALLMAIRPLATADAAARNIDLTYRLAPDLPKINCRATNVHQITLNLLRNAYEAMAGAEGVFERSVVLRTETAMLGGKQRVRILIEDQGPGIAPELGATFAHSTTDDISDDAFSRAEPKRNRTGLGLGLLISQSLLAEDGGHLNFVNRVPRGCTVWFSLPVTDSNSALGN